MRVSVCVCVCLCFFTFFWPCPRQVAAGIMGTASIESTSSLLEVLDEAIDKRGYDFNGAVVRRALKELVNSNFQVCNWDALVTDVKETIQTRFIPDASEPDLLGVTTAEEFFYLLMTQVTQKLLKVASTKIKSKA